MPDRSQLFGRPLTILSRRRRRAALHLGGIHQIKLADQKPLEVTVTDTDGQWHTFRLGPGDGVGYAGIRIDTIAANRIRISHYTDVEHPDIVGEPDDRPW